MLVNSRFRAIAAVYSHVSTATWESIEHPFNIQRLAAGYKWRTDVLPELKIDDQIRESQRLRTID